MHVAVFHDLNRFDLIAEGVETESERATLQRIGCTQYQGFLFSRPVPLATLIDAWLGKQCA
ncbi:MAG: EAL domain-containing protein [Planctomycetales bacterium]|nr:EAL domain-containing protein [Planctomycetales bacterium]